MTTATVAELTELQQALIDARLDTIDRMLLGHVPRPDRITIVSEVEAQIQELLAEKDRPEISREDVLDVLRTLDPPEAYLTDDINSRSLPQERPHAKHAAQPVSQSKPATKDYGWLGGVLGLSALSVIVLYPLAYFLAVTLDSEVMLILGFVLTSLLGFVSGIAGVVLSIQGRRQGALPILGIIGGGLSLPFCGLGLLWTVYLMANM